MDAFFELMTMVREGILEQLIIPGLGISYWKFCIYLLVIGVVATVLINGVRVSSDKASRSSRRSERQSDKQGDD